MDKRELNEILKAITKKYVSLIKQELEDNLVSIVLFGSVARGEATPHSDIDLFIVCENLPQGRMKRRFLFEDIKNKLQNDLEKLWKQEIYTDFIELIYTKDEAKRFRFLYLNMLEDAIILYDKENFIKNLFNKLRYQLNILGTQCKTLGKIRYYVLKPDLKIGEVIEL
jgi:predicted nucleotidyltransferase